MIAVHRCPLVGDGDRCRGLLGRHVVEQNRVGPRLERLRELVEVGCLHVHEPSGPRGLRQSHRLRNAEHGEVVVLEHDPVGQVAAMVHRSPRPHRGLLEGTQTGRGLTGVPDARGSTEGRRVGKASRVARYAG